MSARIWVDFDGELWDQRADLTWPATWTIDEATAQQLPPEYPWITRKIIRVQVEDTDAPAGLDGLLVEPTMQSADDGTVSVMSYCPHGSPDEETAASQPSSS